MTEAPSLTFAEWVEEEEKDWVKLIEKIDDLRDLLTSRWITKTATCEQFEVVLGLSGELAKLAFKCAQYCDDARFVMMTELYRQNPLMKMLYESKLPPGTSPFTEPVE